MAKGDILLDNGSRYSNDLDLWMSTYPERGHWKILMDSFSYLAWGPCWFRGDYGSVYVYPGSRN